MHNSDAILVLVLTTQAAQMSLPRHWAVNQIPEPFVHLVL